MSIYDWKLWEKVRQSPLSHLVLEARKKEGTGGCPLRNGVTALGCDQEGGVYFRNA